jgi:putative SOS response-associated peptidase YedK
MPVVLGPEHFEAWLDCKTTEPKAAQEMLQPAPDDALEAIEMHPQINDSRREKPGIQQPLHTQFLL